MNMNYECQSCKVIGELDEYFDQLDCPQCGGVMLPLSTVEEITSPDFVPPAVDEDATIAIPRTFIPETKHGIKVAAAVDIGFGGMLSASNATGKYSPVSSVPRTPPPSSSSTGQRVLPPIGARTAPPPPPARTAPPAATASASRPPLQGRIISQPPPVVQQATPPPFQQPPPFQPPPPAQQSSSQLARKPAPGVSGGKKSFTMSKNKPAPTSSAGPSATTSATKPAGKSGMMFQKKGKTIGKGAQTSSNRPAAGIMPAQPTRQAPHQPPQSAQPQPPQQDEYDEYANEAAQTQSALPIQSSFQEPSVSSYELQSAAMDQAAKFAALQAELNEERKARIEAEKRAAEEKARLAEMSKIEEEKRAQAAKEAAEKAASEAAERARAQIEKERQEAERQAQEKIKAEREAREKIEREAREKAEKEAKEKAERELAAKAEAEKKPEPQKIMALGTAAKLEKQEMDHNKDALGMLKLPEKKTEVKVDAEKDSGMLKLPEKKSNTEEKSDDLKKSEVASDKKSSDEVKKDTADSEDGKKKIPGQMPKGKGMSPLPGKKGVLPPPKGMSGIGGKKKVPPGKTGMSPAAGATKTPGETGAKPSTSVTKTGMPPTNKTNGGGIDPTKTGMTMGMTNTGLIKLQNKKKTTIYVILGLVVALICLIIIVGMKFLIEGSGPKKLRAPRTTTRVNMNTIRDNSQSQNGGPVSAEAVPAYSQLAGEFSKLNRQTKQMPEKSATDIEAKIKIWQDFVDKNQAEHADDPKLKQAKELIKSLKELKAMY